MRRLTIPAICLIALVIVSVACSSSDDGDDATPTTSAPPPGTATSAPETTATVASTPVATATAAAPSGVITAANAANLKKVSAGTLAESYSRLRWRADGQAVFVTSAQSVYVLLANKDDVSQVYTIAAPARVMDVSGDGKAAVMNDLHTVTIVDTGPDTVLHTLTIDGTVRSANFSPDSKVLAISLEDRIAAQLWDVSTGTLAKEVSGFETAAPVYSVQFGPDSKNLIWLARAKAQVQDLVTDKFGPAASSADFFGAVALSPAEKVLATVAGPELTLWDLDSGDDLNVYTLPAIGTDMAYTADGKLLFVATSGGDVVLELPLLEPVTTLPGNYRAVAVSMSGDGLATISEDGVLSIMRP
jgi:WD40 repeat protein